MTEEGIFSFPIIAFIYESVRKLRNKILLFMKPSCKNNAQIIELWENNNYSNDNEQLERRDDCSVVINVTVPDITVFRPDKPNGTAIINCPGSGYECLSIHNEGYDFADYFNNRGFTYIVLKSRMPKGNLRLPLDDVNQAIKIVRSHSKEWEIKRIGIMGFSAGGHLASIAATHFTEETKVDFQILFYPVITMRPALTHMGSHDNLFGDSAGEELENEYSSELKVNQDTSQAFIIHCQDDDTVPVENSICYFNALTSNHVSASLHIYPKGGHGWGFSDAFKFKTNWEQELGSWLKQFE